MVKRTVKCDYAARAVLGLARHYATGKAVRVETLAREQAVSHNYLVQILIELKTAGLVRSQRGKEGGYRLARAPKEVSLGDVIRCLHGQIFESSTGDDGGPPELKVAWGKLQGAVNEAADEITFQEMLEASQPEQEMYYI